MVVVVVLHTYSCSWWCCCFHRRVRLFYFPKDQSLRPVRMIIDASLLCVVSFIHRLQDSSCKFLLLHCHWLIVAVTHSIVKDFTQVEPQVVSFYYSSTSEHPICSCALRVCAHLRGEREREREDPWRNNKLKSACCVVVWGVVGWRVWTLSRRRI